MKQKLLVVFLLAAITACNNNNNTSTGAYPWPDVQPPVAGIKPFQRIMHGDTVTDNYYWMIDYFKKGPDSTKVVDYLKAENAYLDTMMSGTKKFQEQLFTEMKARI